MLKKMMIKGLKFAIILYLFLSQGCIFLFQTKERIESPQSVVTLPPKEVEDEVEDKDIQLSSVEVEDKLSGQPATDQEQFNYLTKGQWDRCAALGTEAVPCLINLLGNSDWEIKEKAVNSLSLIGTPSVLPLIKALSAKDSSIRWSAASALGEIRDERAITPLIVALEDKAWYVQQKAAEGLVKIGRRAINPLVKALSIGNMETGLQIALCLDRLGWQPGGDLERAWYYLAKGQFDQAGKLGSKAVAPLILLLQGNNWLTYPSVMHTLISIGSPSIQPLISLLKQEDSLEVLERTGLVLAALGKPVFEPILSVLPEINKVNQYQTIAFVLGEIGDERAVMPLINLLKQDNHRIKKAAKSALIKLGTASVPGLTLLLSDKKARIRRIASETLNKLDFCPSNPAQQADYYLAQAQFDQCIALGSASVFSLIRLLSDDDQDLREKAALTLGQMGDERAITPLISALKDQDWQVRWAAATALGKGGHRSFPILINLLRDKDELMRQGAVMALASIADKRAVPFLIKALRDENWQVRWTAVKSLGELNDPQTIKPLIELFQDEDRLVQTNAIQTVVKIGSPAIPYLVQALDEQRFQVRLIAAHTLEELGWQPSSPQERDAYNLAKKQVLVKEVAPVLVKPSVRVPKQKGIDALINDLKQGDWETRNLAEEALAQAGEVAVEPLLAILNYEQATVRASVAFVLGQIGDKRATPYLIALLKDIDWHVQDSAAEALGKIKDSSAVQPLINLLKDKNESIRLKVVQSLGQIADPAAIESLRLALKEDGLQGKAALALGEIGDKSCIPELIALLKTDNSEVKCSIALSLGNLGGTESVKALIQLLQEDDWYLQKKAAQALLTIGQPSIHCLLESLRHKDGDIRNLALQTLEKLNWQPGGEDEIIDYYIAKEYWNRLLIIGSPSVSSLIRVLKDKNKDNRKQAAFILGEIRDLRATKPLIEALAEPQTQADVSQALIKLGKPAMESLVLACCNENPAIRQASSNILIKKADSQTMDLLVATLEFGTSSLETMVECVKDNNLLLQSLVEALLDENKEIRLRSALALNELDWQPQNRQEEAAYYLARQQWHKCKEMGEWVREPVIRFLLDSEIQWRQDAVLLLGEIGGTQTIAPLMMALRDEDTQKQAVKSLIKIGKEAIEPLKGALKDKDWSVRWSAKFILSSDFKY